MSGDKPVVRVLLHDLLAVLEGRAITVGEDRPVELRLFTPEEFLEAQHAAVDQHRPGNADAKIDLTRARDLTQPIRVTGAEPIL